MKHYSIFLSIIFSLLLFGCKKEKRAHWIVADITVLDYYTHEPISFIATMTYTNSSGFGEATHETKNLGSSDGAGHLEVEERISRQDSGLSLLIFADGYNVPYGGSDGPMPANTIKLVKKTSNKRTLYLRPYRFFTLHINNTNCSGLTDSLWINSIDGENTYTALFTGCQDTLYEYGGFDHYTFNQSITFHIKSKKIGVVTASDETFNLAPGFDNQLEIGY